MDDDQIKPELLDVIVRFHDPSRFFELRRAIFSLVCQRYAPIAITLVTQRFSVAQIEKLIADLTPTLSINESVKFKILNFSAPQPLDARSSLLNLGIHRTTGRYLAFLDHDDTIFPHAYRDLIAELASTECAIAFGRIAMKDVEVFSDTLLVNHRRATFKGNNLIDFFEDNFCPIHSFVIDRKKLDAKDLRFDEALALLEDYDFLLRICSTYPSTFHLSETFIGDYYIKNDGTNTLPGEASMNEDTIRSFRRADQMIKTRKEQYVVAESVQRQLGIVPAVAQMTIKALLARFSDG